MQLASWLDVAAMILAIAAGLYLPGAVIAALAAPRRGMLFWVALAPVVSMAIAGAGGIVAAAMGIRWGWGFHLSVCALVLAMVAAGRAVFRRLRGENQLIWIIGVSPHSGEFGNAQIGAWLPATAGVLLAACSVTVRLIRAVPSPDQITQTYDTVFHDNVVARIVQTGEASSLNALPPVRDVYPIAFQQFAALGKLAFPSMTVPAAIMCAWLVFGALVWPISILLFARVVCGRHELSDFLAPVLAVSIAGGPFLLLDWGTLYSMFAGQALAPVLLALGWQWCREGWSGGARICLGGVGWIAVAGLAVSLAHFRVVMTVALVAVPLALVWLVSLAQAVRRIKGIKAMWAAVGVFLAVALAVFAAGIAVFAKMYLSDPTRPISSRLNGGPAQPTEDIPSAIWRFLTGTPIDSAGNVLAVAWLVVAMLLASLASLAVLTRGSERRDTRLLVAGFLLLGFAFVSCAGTHADWAKVVTALWYKDQRRPFAAWAMMAVPIICLGLRLGCDWAAERLRGRMNVLRWAPRMIAAALSVLVCVCSPQMAGMMAAVSNTTRFAANGQDVPMLTSDEYLLLKRIDEHVPDGQGIVSDPWNGSALTLAVGGRTPYYPHLYMAWDADHTYLAEHWRDIETDPKVCSILTANDLGWYLSMGGPYAPDDPNQAMFDGLTVVPGAMSEVDRQDDAVLYRITACG